MEPLLVALLIASPWIFGFSDQGDATAVCVVAGVLVLFTAMTTRWRLALVRLLPLRMHAAIDATLGVLLIVAPFVVGYREDGAPTAVTVVIGAGLILSALGTRWTDDSALVHDRDHVGGEPGVRT